MKAIILAAGMGSRLSHLTEKVPKALISVGKKPLLAHSIDVLKDNGIRDFIIVTGHKAYKIRKYVEENFEEVNVEYVHNHRYDETNNIYSLYLAIGEVKAPFYILNSDIIFHPEIFENIHSSNKRNLTISVDFRETLGKEEMKVKVDGERVVAISKKLNPQEADGEYIGITKVTKKSGDQLYECVSETIEIHGRRVFYEHAFQRMIEKGYEINYSKTSGLPWTEIDTIEDLIFARKEVYPAIAGK